ncbi:carboxylesterase/lipase family protein [Celerinatantimonas sp. MCCC 1A17872]|uniref:carboxylesterase/lipase family protein n=1 Tax=Celerinatantimonas sp. MCCC 1A17872 TaxID=3177514 RepID=UPI0038C12A2E
MSTPKQFKRTATLMGSALIAAALTLPAHAASAHSPLVIQTQSGAIKGASKDQVNHWLGIPYAAPPVGKLRWQAPKSVKAWQGIKTTTHFGDICMQTPPPKGPEAKLKNQPMSENCLTLNVWQPSGTDKNAKLPVMVWIHGGAFRLGATSMPLYNGTHLAKKGVIVVTMNYRLGPLSVFPHPALVKEDAHQALNFGLLDQIAALKWVKNNIRQFGGNPDNVTLWGESAGGASVGYLLQSPQSKGLFAKAIMESGALALPEFTTQQASENVTHELPKSVLDKTPAQLRAISAKELLKLPLAKTATMPIIDGVSLKEKTQQAIASGHYHQVPLLIGSNNYEAGFFPPAWAASVPKKLGSLWQQAQALTDGYGTGKASLKAAQLATDMFATATTEHFATSASHYAPTWRYYFSYVTPPHRKTIPGAIHTSEIPYVFGNLNGQMKPVTEQDKDLSKLMMQRWVHFAKTGNPNPTSLAHWPKWQEGKPTLWSINNNGEKAISEPGKARLEFIHAHSNIQMN